MTAVLLRAGAVLAAVAALAGCDARVQTDLRVTSGSSAQVTVTARFTGEAAEALLANPQTLADLRTLFRERAGAQPEVEQTGDVVQVVVPVSYERLAQSAGVTGISGLTLAGDEDRATLAMTLVPATELTDAVRASVKTQPNAASVAATMLKQTHLRTVVVFPGGIESVTGAAHDGQEVLFSRTADDASTKTVSVVGDPTGFPRKGAATGGVLAAAVAAVALIARRRRSAAQPH